MREIEGNKNELNYINDKNLVNIKEKLVETLKIKFVNFTANQMKKENEDFNKRLTNIISNDFENILNDMIQLFIVDLYDRISELNIQKINILYQKLNYSLYETMIYYLNLSESYDKINLSESIKNEILELNNIESIINIKSKEIFSILNTKLNKTIEENKNYFIQKYLTTIISDQYLESQFNDDINKIIKQKLKENICILESLYIKLMQKNVYDLFNQENINILNKANEDIKYSINNYKNKLLVKLKNYFSLDINEITVDIDNKFKQINLIKEEYESQFTKFKISNEIINFFEIKLIDEIILPNYYEFNKFIIQISGNYDHNSLNFNIEEYKDNFSIQKFENNINETNLYFSSNINNYTHILKDYGLTKEIYELNLKKEIDNYNNEINPDGTIIYDINFDISFNELKNRISIIEQNIKNLNILLQFEEKINNYKKEKGNQYKYSKYILSLNTNNNNYDFILGKLNELNDISLDYYSKAHYLYSKMKEQLTNNISEINELIKSCENITYQTFNTYYSEIKNKFKSIQQNNIIENNKIIIPDYKYNDSDNICEIKGTNVSYTMNYEFNLDIVFGQNIKDPKIIGNLFYNIKPYPFSIFFIQNNSTSGKISRKIDIIFNNIISNMIIVFDSKFKNVTIIKNLNNQKYLIKTQYYGNRINSFEKFYLVFIFLSLILTIF